MPAGRPVKPLSRDAPPAAAALGAELRQRRLACGLTLTALGARAGFSAQHISSLELAATGATPSCVAALDAALDAGGTLLELLPAVTAERLVAADARAAARRYDDEDVEPTNRRGLLGGAAGAALGAAAGSAPAAAREIDPELPAHWRELRRLLGRHDEVFGPTDVLASVKRELHLIAEHRAAARGKLRVELMRVEAGWADLAAWLSEDTGDGRGRDAWTKRALRLAREADYPDMVAFAHARQSAWASDARRAVEYAEESLHVPGVRAQTCAWCSRQAALAHAMAGDAALSEHHIASAHGLLDDEDSPSPPWAGEFRVGHSGTVAVQARCWGVLQPAKAVPLYERALRDWPSAEARDGGIEQARLALACAGAGETDRARAEGRKALAIAKRTKSATATRELRRLGAALAAA